MWIVRKEGIKMIRTNERKNLESRWKYKGLTSFFLRLELKLLSYIIPYNFDVSRHQKS